MAWRLLSFLAVAGFACGPQAKPPDPGPSQEGARLARAVCGAITRCGCAQEFTSDETCAAAYGEAFDEILKRGLEIDDGCLDARVRWFETDDCGEDRPSSCNVFHGDAGEGDACRVGAVGNVAYGSECGEGLSCNPIEGRCAAPDEGPLPTPSGSAKSEGEACDAGSFGSCNRCDLYCAPDGVCRLRGGAGESCVRESCKISGAFGCGDLDEYLYCEGISSAETGTCAIRPKIGEPCDPRDRASCGDPQSGLGYCDPASSTCIAEPAPWLCDETLRGP